MEGDNNSKIEHRAVIKSLERESGLCQLDNPPYSPDLAPSDFHLFPNLKKSLCGRHFADDERLITAVNA